MPKMILLVRIKVVVINDLTSRRLNVTLLHIIRHLAKIGCATCRKWFERLQKRMTPKDIAELDAWSAATQKREAQDDAVCETPGCGNTDSSNKGPLSYSRAFQEFICKQCRGYAERNKGARRAFT
jgi:hypothetical protein